MARFGKLLVILPKDVKAEIGDSKVTMIGPKGTISLNVPNGLKVNQKDESLAVDAKGNSKQILSLQGTIRSHLVNMVKGVTTGWEKKLELVGTGFRAEVRGKELHLTIGLSHPVIVPAPEGITFTVEKSVITVSGIDRAQVGQTSATIRAFRKPDPYKAKGIKYIDEVIRRKAGKQAAKTTTAAA